jgi:hypothetical protein
VGVDAVILSSSNDVLVLVIEIRTVVTLSSSDVNTSSSISSVVEEASSEASEVEEASSGFPVNIIESSVVVSSLDLGRSVVINGGHEAPAHLSGFGIVIESGVLSVLSPSITSVELMVVEKLSVVCSSE